ncbi:MAG TPA: tetratricopeptide repeat protein [Polyangia bacterium]
MRRAALVLLGLSLLAGPSSVRLAHADQATDRARTLYESGLELFYARQHAQALVDFQRAHEVKPRPATLFMMAQCEYLLGSLKEAREHYQAYLTESPTGEFVEVAKDRITSIDRRPATLVINTVPDQADVRITSADPPPPDAKTPIAPVVGQAPNNFSVPRGRWVVSVSKPTFLPQEITVQVGIAETKPLFFKLEPNPARLEIETIPRGATLYINGNRAQNPYRQDVAPGRFEIFAEATDFESRTQALSVGPGGRLLLTGPNALHLRYFQRSGRPELVVASSIMGALVGAGAVAVGLGTELDQANVPAISFTFGGAVTGAIAGALISNNIAPSYIPDNRGLFIIGGLWIGAAEGAFAGIVVRQAQTKPTPYGDYPDPFVHPNLGSQLRGALFGSIPGLVAGTTAAALFRDHAPTYGRVSLIQSAAAGGAIVGSLAALAFQWNPFNVKQVYDPPAYTDKTGQLIDNPPYLRDSRSILNLSLPALIGLNAGLAAGLLGAYLPDQSVYGPSWQRIMLIDLAAGAGALAGGIFACVADTKCVHDDGDEARAHAATVAMITGGLGLVAGIFLTGNSSASPSTASPDLPPPRPAEPETPPPSLGLFPWRDAAGGVVPMVAAAGMF